MSTQGMVHFLLVFDHAKGVLIHQEQFADATKAAEAYSDAEEDHRGEPDLEIVLVGADSIDTIRLTHGHYFASSPLASRYLLMERA